MAQEGIDKLMKLTDSRYRLSMMVAERAAQLKAGFTSVLDRDEVRINWDNAVTVAMKELELHPELFEWGPDVPRFDVQRRLETKRPEREERGASSAEARVFGDN